MEQAIEHGGDASGVGEDFAPFLKWLVGGDDQRFLFVSLIDDFIEQVG